jgi:hypothetical protein
MDVGNIVLYNCLIFLEQNTLYFRLNKNEFQYCSWTRNLNFPFLQSLKYNIFRSENLRTYSIQDSPHPHIFLKKKSEMIKFEISKGKNLASLEPELQKTTPTYYPLRLFIIF